MSLSEVPDESWSEEKLLDLVRLIGQGAAADPLLSVSALEQLSKRTIKDEIGATKALLEAARLRGESNPATQMIVSCLIGLCEHNDSCLNMFAEELNNASNNENSAYCSSLVIKGLSQDKQSTLAPIIFDLALQRGGSAMLWIGSISYPEVRKTMAAQVSIFLNSSSSNTILRAAQIARALSQPENSSTMVTVLDKAVSGWYGLMRKQIEIEVCNYLLANPEPTASKSLLQILKENTNPQIGKTIAAASNRDLVDKLLELAETSWREFKTENNNAYEITYRVLQILPQISPQFFDINKLLSAEDLVAIQGVNSYIRQVVGKIGKEAQPRLFELLKSTKIPVYSFSVACLNDIGTTQDEMAGAFEPPPMIQLASFFYPGKSPAELWADKDGLGDKVRQPNMNNFDLLVELLLHSFGVKTMFVDPGQKAGVDSVGIGPVGLRIYVVGTTTGIIHDDLQKLYLTVRELKVKLPTLTSRFEVSE